jgi:hypothetical protein
MVFGQTGDEVLNIYGPSDRDASANAPVPMNIGMAQRSTQFFMQIMGIYHSRLSK